jgi:uncharacterized protein
MEKQVHLRSVLEKLFLGLALLIAAHTFTAAEVQMSDRLVMASELGDIKEVTELLEKGADPNALDTMGRRALMVATIVGNLEIARFLLERGADVNGPDAQGYGALDAAVINDRPEIFHLLLAKGGSVNGTSKPGSPLIFACIFGRTEFAKVLLEMDAKVHAKDEFGRTPLGVAQKAKSEELIRILESYGAKE